jgi:transketolase
MAAAHHKATNLIALVDRNRIQNDRLTDEVMKLEPLADKWRACGWRVLEAKGHDFIALLTTIDRALQERTAPAVIIAHTIKGKGVSFMENNPAFHGRAPNRQEYEQAMKELA